MKFEAHVAQQLANLEGRNLRRTPRTCEGLQSVYLSMEGRRVLSLCSNNYLGLASHPAVCAAAAAALSCTGYGSAASRHVSGTEATHLRCEQAFADFLGFSRALFFGSGYAANVGTLQALAGAEDVFFSDQLNHASLIDGMRLSRARVHVFKHRDLSQLQELLQRHRHEGKAALVVTDAIFSMDGDVADLQRLRMLCDSHDAALVVDEAHAIGVLGPQGRGLCAALNVRPDVLLAPLGKAFGVMGAVVAGPKEAVHLVENRARSYVFSTAPPPSQAAAALAALSLVQSSDDRRTDVMAGISDLARGLRDLGFEVPRPQCPIIPLQVGAADAVAAMSSRLFELGVFAHGIRPPTVPPGTSRLRLTLSAAHQDADIDFALSAFAQLKTTTSAR